MLDSSTKRRIDSCRDILVGRIPDPKAQVEHITLALMYKFMDDMDNEAVELGGHRKFFTGEFDKYRWSRLVGPEVGGHDALNLYDEAITRMAENPKLPELFRTIFRNAYLPFRDPQTIRLFLGEINKFEYDHSEKLGDAFEYLLSVLGSQGDAGQFRTPRHIIDFMVRIIDPQKGEVLLDPACGTAGFLISAYKHILSQHGPDNPLTPQERTRLAGNVRGYDISPDMVRLSLVNMYLHGIPNPKIEEHDTITSKEKWQKEYADVILANPPFMSPKGGISPHKLFSVQSNRSEVLFVDYIAEHLSLNGRAAVIVPEGIIFQSQTAAYKALRKMLVEQSLVAVVSLPAGVFNPYSGVKTSILILDKSLAKQSDTVGFFKVENDGFNLGAQRRPIDRNDLPQVLVEIEEYLAWLRANNTDYPALSRGLIVSKEKIADNGNFNLSGESYREARVGNHAYPLIRLVECEAFKIRSGGTPKSDVAEYWDGDIAWATLADLPAEEFISEITSTKRTITRKGLEESSAFLLPINSVIVSTRATIGRIAINRIPVATNQGFKSVVICDAGIALPEYVALALTQLVPTMQSWATGGTFAEISKKQFGNLEIPLPPLGVQKEIVAEIQGYQRVIDGARAVLDHYRPYIPINLDWPMVSIMDVCEVKSGGTPSRTESKYWEGDIPWVTTTLIDYGIIDRANEYITREGLVNSSTWIVPKGTVLMAMYGQGVTRGRVAILGIDAAINQACAAFLPRNDSVDPEYLFRALQSSYENLRKISEARGGNQSNLSAQVLKDYTISLPPLVEQKKIVAEIEAEQQLVQGNRQLIERIEQKIAATLARVWSESPVEQAEAVPAATNGAQAIARNLFGEIDPPERALRVACRVIAKVQDLGKTFLEKGLHLVEAFCDIPMGRRPLRMEHGPADLAQHDIIVALAKQKEAFTAYDHGDGQRTTYKQGKEFKNMLDDADGILGDKKAAVDDLLNKLSPLKTNQMEWLATAYGSWNDFIKAGTPEPTDDQIINDIRKNWHPSKSKVKKQEWQWTLDWLRKNNVVPTGNGPKVERASISQKHG